MKSLEAEARQLLDVFKAATATISRSGTARKRKPAARGGDGTLSPKQVADRLGVSVDKIRGFITNGELDATNVAAPTSSRPRWRISEANLTEFQKRRQPTKPTPTAKRPSRKRDDGVKEYF